MDSLLAYFKKNTVTSVVMLLTIPIAGALIYGALRSFWLRSKYKKNGVAIYEFLLKSGGEQNAKTTDEIAKTLNISKNDVISLCTENPKIVDAGKRQRSWKLKSEGDVDEGK